ncbi:MAG: hypothetical protein Q8P90_05720 [bacterium]|nr:hypothetical protein [bacterium]
MTDQYLSWARNALRSTDENLRIASTVPNLNTNFVRRLLVSRNQINVFLTGPLTQPGLVTFDLHITCQEELADLVAKLLHIFEDIGHEDMLEAQYVSGLLTSAVGQTTVASALLQKALRDGEEIKKVESIEGPSIWSAGC